MFFVLEHSLNVWGSLVPLLLNGILKSWLEILNTDCWAHCMVCLGYLWDNNNVIIFYLSTRVGRVLWKDPLVTFLEVIGLAATGLGAEWGKKTARRPSVFTHLDSLFSVQYPCLQLCLLFTFSRDPLFYPFQRKRKPKRRATSFWTLLGGGEVTG